VERQAVAQGLLSLDHFPAGMEQFPASDDDAWALIRGVIDDSDYYVLVIGGRYGSINAEGISYTEMEFDYAMEKKKPVLAFLHAAPDDIPAGKTDKDDTLRAALEAFKKKEQLAKHVKYWKNPDELKAQVIQSISAETKRNPQEGWIRAGRSTDPSVVETMRQEIARLSAELGSVRVNPPVGADQYAQGADLFEVTIEYHEAGKIEPQYLTVPVQWQTIFTEVGPTLMGEATERMMRQRQSEELWKYSSEIPENGRRFVLMEDDFDTIKVQIVALGLMQKSPHKHVPSDTNKYWSLTPFGETTLTKARAITRKMSGPKAKAAE
jgi:hypothetical protein